ncbi:MAG: DUF452 family protein, partial [Rikenellaceae bacterium]|jgi:biotin synthesis protein BioG|nr:DUF452 family protein [Rikenellaceae bacterium]
MDARTTAHLAVPEGTDLCVCFDYTDLDTPDAERWESYAQVRVVAWSMGVWAAAQVVPTLELDIVQAVAVNGTPTPVDDRYGIPERIARGTCDNLTEQSFFKFMTRVSRGFKFIPESGLEARKAELSRIINATTHAGQITWNRAIVSTQDAIFPPENLRNYWTGRCPVHEIEAPHYPFHLFKRWEELVNE